MSYIEVLSEVTGTIWKIESLTGQSIDEGDDMMIVESMKMEIPITAPAKGTIIEFKVTENDPVKEGQVVALIKSAI